MVEVTGVTTRQITQASDDYAWLLDQELHALGRALVRAWEQDPTEDSLLAARTLWLKQVEARLGPTLALLFHTGAAGVRDQLRDALTAAASRTLADIPQVSPQLVDAYLATAANRLSGVADLLWEAARDQLREGQAAGESQARLAQRIRKATGLALPRAKVIARTEARDALLAGALNQVRATGLTGTKRWIAVRSYKTRPEHRHAHGQEVDLQGFFEVGGWPMDRPHDEVAPPELTVNCRCGLAFSLDASNVTLAVEPQRTQADQRLLKEVWDAGIVRQGVTKGVLAGLLADLGLTAGAEVFHLPGKHPQKSHGGGGGSPHGSRLYPERDQDWAEKHFNAVNDGWPPEVREAVVGYSGGGYRAVNRWQRRGGDYRPSPSVPSQAQAETMMDGLDRSATPLPEPVTLFRGVDIDVADRFEVGTRIRDKGYMSTSLDHDISTAWGEEGWKMEIRVNAGQPVTYVPPRLEGEQEMILPRGIEMRVLSKENNTIVVEVV